MAIWLMCLLASGPSAMPYSQAGLTREEAAAHILNRLTFGPRPGQVEEVMRMGLDTWLERQLAADLPEDKLKKKIALLPAIAMSDVQLLEIYRPLGQLLEEAVKEGVLESDERSDLDENRQKVARWARGKGYKMPRELDAQLIKWKFQRALLSENQVREVMADFWFNHFTVSLKDPQARGFVMSYDRDAIQPHALGSFRTMLGATAKHPAMLLYLDNAQSTASKDTDTTMMANLNKLASKDGVTGRVGKNWRRRAERRMKNENRPKGVNENYARELLELHTLGVDGGYDQQDVEEVARAFTGWTLYPMGPRGERMRQRLQKRHRAGVAVGFERQGSFLFRSDAHDAEAKLILGERFPSGGGLEEGERVLDMLTTHTSTARFIATKMARRFVMDHPPETLINPMAAAFYDSGGDIKAVIRAMVQSPEFWSAEARKGKVKTPFELMISSLRILDAKVPSVRPSIKWIERLGQPIYRAPGPDGFPDLANRWINSGTLLQRIELAKKLAEGELGGVRFSVQDIRPSGGMGMVHMWASQLLPGRDVTNTVALIQQAPELKGKDGSYANELVIGLVLGSPEFQRK